MSTTVVVKRQTPDCDVGHVVVDSSQAHHVVAHPRERETERAASHRVDGKLRDEMPLWRELRDLAPLIGIALIDTPGLPLATMPTIVVPMPCRSFALSTRTVCCKRSYLVRYSGSALKTSGIRTQIEMEDKQKCLPSLLKHKRLLTATRQRSKGALTIGVAAYAM